MKVNILKLSIFPAMVGIASARPPSLRRRRRKLNSVWVNADPSLTPPFGLCEGHCNSSADCEQNMGCFARDGYGEVPGCDGGRSDHTATHYCVYTAEIATYRPDAGNPKLIIYPDNPPVQDFPLGLCEGDCDGDDDCAEGLRCFERDRYQAVPGCQGGENIWSLADFCALPRPTTMEPTQSSVPSASPSESASPTTVVSVYAYQGDPPASAYPLGLCEGDCDDDADCADGLRCFQRDRYQAVPSCRGAELVWSKTDFCTFEHVFLPPPTDSPTYPPTVEPSIEPTSHPSMTTPVPTELTTVLFVHPGDPPSSAYPLGLCQGDCDSDDECSVGLRCYFRERHEAVPGCYGGEDDGSKTDYCTYPWPTSQPTTSPAPSISAEPSHHPSGAPTFSAAPSKAPSSSPSGIPSASPTDRPTYPPTVEPSMEPTSHPSMATPVPTELTTVLFVHPGDPPSSAYPLGLCQGDCDSDDECSEGLQCYFRERHEAVPGCYGGEDDGSKTDYCTYPWPTSQPTTSPAPSISAEPSHHPSGAPTFSASPSKALSPSPSHAPNNHPMGEVYVYPGVPPASAFPLGLCEGDCDGDEDCAEGLRCFQRDRYTPVPGCEGGESMWSKTDFCTYPGPLTPTSLPTAQPTRQATPAPTSMPSSQPLNPTERPLGSLVVKIPGLGEMLGLCEGDCDSDADCGEELYCHERDGGEEVPGCLGGASDARNLDYCTYADLAPVPVTTPTHFRLQLAENGNNWCIGCENNCQPGTGLYLRQCSGRSTYFEFQILEFGEILIQATGTLFCLERSGQNILFRVCDTSSPLQRWFTDSNGNGEGGSFEISQYGYDDYCISPERAAFAESIGMQTCTSARTSNISIWAKY